MAYLINNVTKEFIRAYDNLKELFIPKANVRLLREGQPTKYSGKYLWEIMFEKGPNYVSTSGFGIELVDNCCKILAKGDNCLEITLDQIEKEMKTQLFTKKAIFDQNI